MDHLRPIVIEDFASVAYATQLGPAPQTQWIEIDALRIDDRYQRPIGQRGKIQIRRIAERFRWSRFAPVIVAPIEGGLYAVIDGQHRCHAARLRGIKSVPCMISMVDEVEQAEAFAEINTRQLAVTPAVLHKSRVAANDPKAIALELVLSPAGARVVTPRHQKELKRGDTFAVAILYKLQEAYGDETLKRACEAIVQVGDGNIGMVRAPVLQAYCAVFEATPALRDHPELLDSLDSFDLPAAYQAMAGAIVPKGELRWRRLATALERHLRLTLKAAA
ncbi:ParB N-terminal domain-containing protein [Bosea sp. SSUT16]|uniref:ParB N-terminal domain-containing protein n=1 Tax=Bosea spartocytisi TaxID=2773451 RepID=A0A927E833_9HYPH|nr:DUF6551 family protein [Bosea spartocytisi]MBD3845972.1 ParB N-terminal domain-containing protein [Bosea spartocytisi]MCT4473156.1 ParB N-terminal domain-containing protein [Bosea spartocytisi]